MAKRTSKGGDRVGYGKPPKHTQFKPGQSGNPGGRPKGASSFATELRKAGDRVVPISVSGKTEQMTLRQAVAHRTWLEAAKGKPKYLELISKLDVEPPAAKEESIPNIEVTLVLEDEPPPHIRARQLEFAAECPNFDPDRPEEEWGPDEPDGVQ